MAIKSHVEDPESLDEVNSLSVSENIKHFVTELNSDIDEAQVSRSEWETRQDIYMKKRYGIRAPKVFPWVGAANFVLPQIDSDINRLKPSYVGLISTSPIVTFEPFGPEDIEPAKKREILFDWRMKTQVRFFNEYCLGVDYALQRGFTVFKIGWKFSTRKYTKYLDLTEVDPQVLDALFMPEMTDQLLYQILVEEAKPDMSFDENVSSIKDVIKEFRTTDSTRFEMEFVEKADNQPFVKACDPRDEVVFPTNVSDIQQAPFVDYRFWVSKNDVKIAMQSERYEKFDDYEIESWVGAQTHGRSNADTIRSVRDGISLNPQPNEMILMHEVCTWYDVDGDGIDERVIITYPDADPNAILRFIENPYDHAQFPYVVVRREINDAKILSARGIPALDDDFQTGISTIFNQDIDAGTISTTPTVVSRKNSIKNLRSLRYVPGQHIETENGPNDYAIVQNQNLGQGNRFASMQYLKAWANDRIGNISAAFSQVNNPKGQGGGGSKSATESSAIAAAAGQLQAMDLIVWQMQMADVYYQIDALYDQFGDDEEEIAITNEPPVRITRREIQGKFNMIPNGRIDNSNPVLRANKALALYDRFQQNPFVDMYQLTKFTLNELDAKTAKLIMKPMQQIQDEQVQQQQNIKRQKAEALMTQLQLRSLADHMDIQKESALYDLELIQAARMKQLGGKIGLTIADVNKGS